MKYRPTTIQREITAAGERALARYDNVIQGANSRIATVEQTLLLSWSQLTAAPMAKLSDIERRDLAQVIANHFVAIQRSDEQIGKSVENAEDSLETRRRGDFELVSEQTHLDSTDVACRALCAEELSALINAMIEPLLNNKKEYDALERAMQHISGVIADVWPKPQEETAPQVDQAGSERRGIWNKELLRIVASRLPENTSNHALRQLTSEIATALGMEKAPSANALRFRTKSPD